MAGCLPVAGYYRVREKKDKECIAPEKFEAHMEALTNAGYKGIGLYEAHDYLMDGKEIPDKSVLITLIGGYLDNWVFAYPILKKFGMKAVLLVVPEHLEDPATPRLTLEDVWAGIVKPQELPPLDKHYYINKKGFGVREETFINRTEATMLSDNNIADCAPMSLKHRLVFKNPKFRSLYLPGQDKHPFSEVDAEIIPGLPRFETGPALCTPAFLPSEELMQKIRELVPEHPKQAKEFFNSGNGEKEVRDALRTVPKLSWGRIETEDEFKTRIRAELEASKNYMENMLGKPCRAMAWPWGKYTKESLAVAQDVGFHLFFCTTQGPNRPAKKPWHVHRFDAVGLSPSKLVSRVRIFSKPFTAWLNGTMGT